MPIQSSVLQLLLMMNTTSSSLVRGRLSHLFHFLKKKTFRLFSFQSIMQVVYHVNYPCQVIVKLMMSTGWFNCCWCALWQPCRNVWNQTSSSCWGQSWDWASICYNGVAAEGPEWGENSISCDFCTYLGGKGLNISLLSFSVELLSKFNQRNRQWLS